MTPLEKVTERLTWMLRLHAKHGGRTRRMEYEALPLLTDLKFEGVRLRRLMSPPVPSEPAACEQLFDTFLSPIQEGEGEGNPLRDLGMLGGDALATYVAQGATVPEMAVRLIFALSNAEDAELRHGDDYIAVAHHNKLYGINKGVVFSRFCNGLDLGPVQVSDILKRTGRTRTFDAHFCSLYREANRRGKHMKEALIAIHMGNPGFDFGRMAQNATPKRYPPQAKLAQWERMLSENSGPDPLAKLYASLVPIWMTQGEFGRVIAPVTTRPLTPGPKFLQGCINRLFTFFHKNNKDQ